ncbi:hypothetical protein K402DRAFT_73513 [Aulographum hederae CBS 113979]|uniref:Secreted protein n=1 Tax=Aulographum hederae CBS 113979 TaxID=1176131 RepID=A0A6G1HFI1_9PEZI|nr:hypothetical protein K402DRAFT_73513 [Aulographum hederae CBS 113979]
MLFSLWIFYLGLQQFSSRFLDSYRSPISLATSNSVIIKDSYQFSTFVPCTNRVKSSLERLLWVRRRVRLKRLSFPASLDRPGRFVHVTKVSTCLSLQLSAISVK